MCKQAEKKYTSKIKCDLKTKQQFAPLTPHLTRNQRREKKSQVKQDKKENERTNAQVAKTRVGWEPHKHLSAWALVHWQIPQMLAAWEQHAPFILRPSNQRRRQYQQQPSGGAASVRLRSENRAEPSALAQHSISGKVHSRLTLLQTRSRGACKVQVDFPSVARVDRLWVSVTTHIDITLCVWYWSGRGKRVLWKLPTERIYPDGKTVCSGGCSGPNLVCVCARACVRSEWAGRVYSSSEVKLSVWMLF